MKNLTDAELVSLIDQSLKQTAKDVRDGKIPLDGRARLASLSNDEMADRIVRSLKENSAELAAEQRSQGNARVLRYGLICLVFVAGIAAGALIATAL